MKLVGTSSFSQLCSNPALHSPSSIADIKMDIAVPDSIGSGSALEVEQCACPQGYRGPSCQVGWSWSDP